MYREISPGIYWIHESLDRTEAFENRHDGEPPDWYEPGRKVYTQDNAYLLSGEESLLFDTTSPLNTDSLFDDLDEILDGSSLDYILPSHTDLPHSANTLPLLNRYPNASLLGPKYGTTHGLYHLGEATKVGEGDSIDLGGLVAEFHDSPFIDAPATVWMSERESKTLFTVDWIPHWCLEGLRLKFSDEFDIPEEVYFDLIARNTRSTMFWFEYSSKPKLKAEIDRLIEKHQPEYLAPAHGNVVRKGAIDVMERQKEVVDHVAEKGKPFNDL